MSCHRLRSALIVLLLSSGSACQDGGADDAPSSSSAAAISSATRPTPDGIRDLPLDLHILVDQFGYRPDDPKVAVIRSPVQGYDASDTFSPGKLYEVRPSTGGDAVHVGGLDIWNGGAVQKSSGDRGWWFDFSLLKTPGEYVIVDIEKQRRSAVFTISDEVYRPVLKAAMRMFYYQRSGIAKDARHAGACWADDAAYVRPFQDLEARDVAAQDNAATARDVSGGWADAGDNNRYVTFANTPVHQLLGALRDHPSAFTDDYDIPESGNGIPDLLDEVDYEIDWLLRMQNPDGSAALKVGSLTQDGTAPPSADKSKRYYIARCSSATLSVAGLFAHAALAYRDYPALAQRGTLLEIRARKAWDYFREHPGYETDCDTKVIRAGDADRTEQDQRNLAATAAIYLFALTGEQGYHDWFLGNAGDMQPFRDLGFTRYNAHEGEALLFYAGLPNADPKMRQRILDAKSALVKAGNGVYGLRDEDDLYRSFMHDEQYHWGSNMPRANYGSSNVAAVRGGFAKRDAASVAARALGTLHYFHGVNPFGMVYLTNMARYGATRSVNAIFHSWFRVDSKKWSTAGESQCGPAPGYVPGGPNRSAASEGVPATVQPPVNQPLQKSFKDWNDYREGAWTISEPAIYYQAAYIRLLAAFVDREPLTGKASDVAGRVESTRQIIPTGTSSDANDSLE